MSVVSVLVVAGIPFARTGREELAAAARERLERDDEDGALALLLTDRQLARPVVQAFAQADLLQQMPGPGRVGATAAEAHAQEHVLQGGEAGQQMVALAGLNRQPA